MLYYLWVDPSYTCVLCIAGKNGGWWERKGIKSVSMYLRVQDVCVLSVDAPFLSVGEVVRDHGSHEVQ